LDSAYGWSRTGTDERVLNAACRLWRWAYYHVDTELHDAPCAAELLKEVALEVTPEIQSKEKAICLEELELSR
jgi:hypothetical protein